MALTGWREMCDPLLEEKIGPVAAVVVDDVLTELGVREQEVTASHFVRFVRLLYEKLPDSIDRRAFCHDFQAGVLRKYGFGKP
jgi:hypothetical protein